MQRMSRNGDVRYSITRLFIIELESDFMNSDDLYSLMCRAIRASLMLSYGIRRDTYVCFFIKHLNKSILCQGDVVKGLHVDEPSCMGFLKKFFRRQGSIGLKIVDSCQNYVHVLNLQQLELEYLLYSNANELKRGIKIKGKGIYIKIVSDIYGNTEIGLKLWNALSITNIVLDNIIYNRI